MPEWSVRRFTGGQRITRVAFGNRRSTKDRCVSSKRFIESYIRQPFLQGLLHRDSIRRTHEEDFHGNMLPEPYFNRLWDGARGLCESARRLTGRALPSSSAPCIDQEARADTPQEIVGHHAYRPASCRGSRTLGGSLAGFADTP